MEKLSDIDAECIRCGVCEKQQCAEGMPVIMCGDLAEELEAARDITEVSPGAHEFLLSCSLCDACTAYCPQLISCAQLVKTGRERLLGLQPELARSYRPYRVDYRENFFTELQKASGFAYDDVLDSSPRARDASRPDEGIGLFFPGCSLSSYSEELTKATHDLLLNRGAVQGMSVYCCGKPLSSIGAPAAYRSYGTGLIERLRERRVSRLIVACPNCYCSLDSLFGQNNVGDIAIEALPRVLLELGLTYTGGEFACISVHDSCPDRTSLCFAQATRALLAPGGMDIREMESQGTNTICCGAGGFAQVGGPEHSAARRARRVRQFEDTGADCLVCSCIGCVNAFLSDENAPETRHYLELLLDSPINWDAVQHACESLYDEDEVAFERPLSESTKVFEA